MAEMLLRGPVEHKWFSSSTDGAELIPGVAGKKVRILGLAWMAGGSVNHALAWGASPTQVVGPMNASAAPSVMPVSEHGWGDFPAGEGVDLDLSAAVTVSGNIVYAYV